MRGISMLPSVWRAPRLNFGSSRRWVVSSWVSTTIELKWRSWACCETFGCGSFCCALLARSDRVPPSKIPTATKPVRSITPPNSLWDSTTRGAVGATRMLRKKSGSKDLTQRTPRKKRESTGEGVVWRRWCCRAQEAGPSLRSGWDVFLVERTLLTPDWSFGQLDTALLAEDKGFYSVA